MTKKTAEKFLDQLDGLSYRLNDSEQWRREAFIAGYEQKPLLAPSTHRNPWFKVAVFSGFVLMNKTASDLGMETLRTSVLVTVGLLAIFGLQILHKRLRAEKEYARAKKLMLNLKPGQRQKILETGKINSLSDAYALGWFCHRQQSNADIEHAVQVIKSNNLLEEYTPTDAILQQAKKPAARRKIHRDHRYALSELI